jgi:hypothetical protein
MHQSPQLFPCVGFDHANTRWGQILDFSSIVGVLEVVSAANAKEAGVAQATRLSHLFADGAMPKLSSVKKNIDTKLIQSLVLLKISETSCQLCIVGAGKIFLRRGSILAPLLVNEGMLSGGLEGGDCLILLSKTAVDILSSEEKALFSPNLTPKEIAQAMMIRFSQKGRYTEGCVALVVAVPAASSFSRPSKGFRSLSAKHRIKRCAALVRGFVKRPKFIPYTIAIALGLAFVISVFLGIRKQQHDVVYTQRTEAIRQAKQLFDEGVALMDLQPIKSREHFKRALDILSSYSGKNLPRGKDGNLIKQLQSQIQDSVNIVSKVYTADVQLFYDASFLQKDRVVSLFTVGEHELGFADTTAGMIGIVSLLSKDADIVAGGDEYKSTKFLSFQGSTLFIVTQSGVNAISPGSDRAKTVLPADEQSWDAFATYGGNLYAVSKTDGKILRYPKKEGGYGKKEEYLDKDIYANLRETRGISIDGSIWLGSNLGKIFRYTQRRDDPFLIRGVDPALGQKLEVFVSEYSPSVYVFDPEGKRIVTLSKEGVYQGQYVYGDTIEPTAFGVSPERKRVFLLANQKIYSFAMK